MNLLDSLLDAIVRLDGDALVMHVGEKPYVVTTSEATNEFRGPLAWGQVELSSRVLTSEAVVGMLGQILPIDQRAALDEYGATDYEVAAANNPAERFTIVAARGGDDIWLEVRRQSKQRLDEPVVPIVAEPQLDHAATEAHAPGTREEPAHAVAPVPVEAEPPVALEHEAEQIAAADEREEPVTGLEEPVQLAPEAIEQEIERPFDGDDEEESLTEAVMAARDEALDAEHESLASMEDVIADNQDWGDDVMTEGDLGELLRASATAVIQEKDGTGAEPGPHSGFVVGDDDAGDAVTDSSDIDFGELVAAGNASSGDEDQYQQAVERVEEDEDIPEYALVAAEHQLVAVEAAAILTPAEQAVKAAHEALMAAQGISLADADPSMTIAEIPNEQSAPAAEQEIATVSLDEVVLPAQPALSTVTHELHATEHRQTPSGQVPESGAPELEALADPVGAVPEPTFAVAQSGEHEAPDTPRAIFSHVPEEEAVSSTEETEEALETTELDGEDVPSFRHAAVVLPLTRQPRPDGSGDVKGGVAATLQRLLRLAAARGAAMVYVVAQSAPMVRVDGEFSVLDGEPTLNTAFVERLLAELTPRARDAAAGPAAEWISDVPEIGRVRCVTFRDHRGPGIIFRMVPPRAISADQLGLSAEVQALCSEADGLVLVAGGRGSGRSTLLASFVDLINRTRSDYVIAAESQIEFVHENKRSFISQREVRGSGEAVAAAVRAAIREEPDVLIVEDLRTPELVSLALEAAESGRLVFASVPALSAVSAVERVIEMFPAERREKAQASLAGALRGVVSQVLLRKLRGGRVAAREVLINTPAVASLIAEGRTFELHAALDSGRRFGMTPFSESLAALVREGTVHPSHAHRKAPDREQFLSVLRRDGVDTSVAERLA